MVQCCKIFLSCIVFRFSFYLSKAHLPLDLRGLPVPRGFFHVGGNAQKKPVSMKKNIEERSQHESQKYLLRVKIDRI